MFVQVVCRIDEGAVAGVYFVCVFLYRTYVCFVAFRLQFAAGVCTGRTFVPLHLVHGFHFAAYTTVLFLVCVARCSPTVEFILVFVVVGFFFFSARASERVRR